jgi:hypothetical protein
VALSDGSVKKTVVTNGFGDFEFEGLEASKTFSIKIVAPGYQEKQIEVDTVSDVTMGDIYLNP